jgi:hypothetical protein
MSGQRNGLRGDRLDRADEGGFARMDKARAPGRADGLVQRKASREVEAPMLEGRRGLTIDAFSVADTAPAVQLEAFDSAVARTHEALAEADGGLFGGRSGRASRTAFDGPASADTFDLMGGASSAPVQMKTDGHTGRDTDDIQSAAAHGTRGGGGKLPYFERIQAAFGNHDISGIRSHVGGAAREASDAIGAEAYATGSSVAFRSAPSLHTAAHEAAHIVQQRAGVSLKGGVGESGDRYERHADAVADAVVSGKSAEGLLGPVRSGGLAGVQRAAKQGQGSQQNDGGDLTETVTAEDLAKAKGINIAPGLFHGASSPTGVGLRNITANVASNHPAVKVKMNRQTAEEAAKILSGSLKKMASEALNGLVNGGNGMSASVTFNVPLPWTSGLGMVGLTLGGGFSKVNQQTYKCSLIGQVTALAKAGAIVEVYAKIFGSLAVEAEGPLGEMPGLLEGALWKSLGTCLDMVNLKNSAGFYIRKSNDALAKKKGKTKAIQGVGFEAGFENRANASKAAASLSGEKSQEFEKGEWKNSDAHAVAVMGAGVTGGYKWTEGKNGNGKKSLELCVQADKAGIKNVKRFLSSSLRGFCVASNKQFPIATALNALEPQIGAAGNAKSPLFQGDSQAKIELKAEFENKKWTYAAALTYVKIQKLSDDKNPGFSAQLGFEKKVGRT